MRKLLLLAILAGVMLISDIEARQPMTKPKALAPGDTIAIVAPAYPLNEERIALVKKRLEEQGFKVKLMPNIFERTGFLAGPDEVRAKYFMEAWLDPEVDAVMPGTGGYGAMRVLNLLDWEAIAKHPKMLTGFSDITALHLAFQAKTNFVTFHTPNPMWGLGSDNGFHPQAGKYFWRNLLSSEYFDEKGERLKEGWVYDTSAATTAPLTLAPGQARGRLTGGNLSLVAALMGTPYEIETKGRILFLEDVGERPYRVDRMLSQLDLGGKLDGLAGVVLGRFSKCDPEDPAKEFTCDEVLMHYFKGRPYPVVWNYPVGHIVDNTTLPVGAMAELDADGRRLTLLEDPVSIP